MIISVLQDVIKSIIIIIIITSDVAEWMQSNRLQLNMTMVRLVQTLHCASVPTMSRQQSVSVTLVYIYRLSTVTCR